MQNLQFSTDWWRNIFFFELFRKVSHGDRDKGYSHSLSFLFYIWDLCNKDQDVDFMCLIYWSCQNQIEMSFFVIKYREERVFWLCQNQENFDPFDHLYPLKIIISVIGFIRFILQSSPQFIGFSWIEFWF